MPRCQGEEPCGCHKAWGQSSHPWIPLWDSQTSLKWHQEFQLSPQPWHSGEIIPHKSSLDFPEALENTLEWLASSKGSSGWFFHGEQREDRGKATAVTFPLFLGQSSPGYWGCTEGQALYLQRLPSTKLGNNSMIFCPLLLSWTHRILPGMGHLQLLPFIILVYLIFYQLLSSFSLWVVWISPFLG